MVDWPSYIQGMDAARKAPDVGLQSTAKEVEEASGLQVCALDATSKQIDWHDGFDYAIMLARNNDNKMENI